MSLLVGVSSSCLRHGSAQDLLDCAAAVGAGCLDLRAGRGQGWELEFDLIAEALPVAFVGVSASLGAGVGEAPAPPELMHAMIKRGIPLRLFVEPLDDATAVRRFAGDVARLRGAWGTNLRLAVEPHAAAPSLAQLDAVLAEHSVSAVVDTLGLIRQNARLDDARAFLLRHAIAVQVKGLALCDGEYHHVALDYVPLLTRWTAALLAGAAQVPVTVETKAGTVAEDIRTIRRLTADCHDTLPGHVPQEISSCVLAS
jgi:hypothetical protein